VLVAPVHPTLGDLQWFASLAGRYTFEVTFLDVRWLESKLAERPDIARYVLTTPHQEVVEMVRELREEQAALLGGAPDLQARLEVLRGRVDALSPVWGMNFVSHGDRQSIGVFPKPGGSPQRVVVHLDVNADDPRSASTYAAVTDAVDYGTGTVIEPGFITCVDNDALAALSLPWEQAGMVLADQRITDGFPRAALLRPRNADGRLGRPLHLTLLYATVGGRGMDIRGTDATGMLRTRLRVDRPDVADEDGGTVAMLLQYGARDHDHAASVDPEAQLRTLQVLDALDRTTGMALTLHDSSELVELHLPRVHWARRPAGLPDGRPGPADRGCADPRRPAIRRVLPCADHQCRRGHRGSRQRRADRACRSRASPWVHRAGAHDALSRPGLLLAAPPNQW
jgi:hypothetical protein